MTYRIRIDSHAVKKLRQINKELLPVIASRIGALASDPRPPGCKLLKDSNHAGWAIRFGKYRILYRIYDSEQAVEILDIDLRDRIYKRKD